MRFLLVNYFCSLLFYHSTRLNCHHLENRIIVLLIFLNTNDNICLINLMKYLSYVVRIIQVKNSQEVQNFSPSCILFLICRWFVAYRDAQSFRFSHYFVCFFSEVTATLSGVGASSTNGDLRW